MKKIGLMIAMLTVSMTASADICGIVTQSQAELALSFLKKGAVITQTYAVDAELKVANIEIKKAAEMGGETYYDLLVNGQSIDPGHTNIVINKKVSLNLGRLVGCDVEASDPNIIVPTSIKEYLK